MPRSSRIACTHFGVRPMPLQGCSGFCGSRYFPCAPDRMHRAQFRPRRQTAPSSLNGSICLGRLCCRDRRFGRYSSYPCSPLSPNPSKPLDLGVKSLGSLPRTPHQRWRWRVRNPGRARHRCLPTIPRSQARHRLRLARTGYRWRNRGTTQMVVNQSHLDPQRRAAEHEPRRIHRQVASVDAEGKLPPPRNTSSICADCSASGLRLKPTPPARTTASSAAPARTSAATDGPTCGSATASLGSTRESTQTSTPAFNQLRQYALALEKAPQTQPRDSIIQIIRYWE